MNEQPCTSCGQAPPIAKEQESLELNYRAKESGILTKRGKRESLMQPLISSFGNPIGGWYVNIKIKGIAHKITGSSAIQVFTKVKNALKSNSVELSDLDIWFNLNMQWYARVPEKYQIVKLVDLLALARPIDGDSQPIDPTGRNYTPKDWGAAAWDMMGVYLAQDNYSWSGQYGFDVQLEIVKNMLNNDINPSIGCNECYIEFTKELNALRNNPPYTVDEARTWLTDFHNSVNKRLGKPFYNKEYAAKRYKWV